MSFEKSESDLQMERAFANLMPFLVLFAVRHWWKKEQQLQISMQELSTGFSIV